MTAYFIEEGSAMNKWKMILTALITACAIVPQTAAYHLRGTPIMRYDSQKLLSGALSNLKEAESLHTTLDLDLTVKVYGLPLSAQAVFDMTVFHSPLKLRADTTLDLGLFGRTSLQAYARQTKDAYQLFFQKDSAWQSATVADAELEKYDGGRMMEACLTKLDQLTFSGKEWKSGKILNKYTGILRHEALQELLLDIGSIDLLADLLKKYDALESMGTLLLENKSYIEELMKTSQDLDVALWIEPETSYPVQCQMDITQMLNEALEILKKQLPEENTSHSKGLFLRNRSPWSSLKISDAEIAIFCDSFNSAEDFSIPVKALRSLKDAAADRAEGFTATSWLLAASNASARRNAHFCSKQKALKPASKQISRPFSAPPGARTLIKSQVLYQLS